MKVMRMKSRKLLAQKFLRMGTRKSTKKSKKKKKRTTTTAKKERKKKKETNSTCPPLSFSKTKEKTYSTLLFISLNC